MSRRRRGRAGRPEDAGGSPPPGGAGGRSLLHAWPDAVLDLHGRSVPEAEGAVRNFLETQSRLGAERIVHVVTGKGTGTLFREVGRLLDGPFDRWVGEAAADLQGAGWRVRVR